MTLPPGPRLPTLAQTLDWVYRPARFMQRCQARYGDYFTVRLLGLSASGSARGARPEGQHGAGGASGDEPGPDPSG